MNMHNSPDCAPDILHLEVPTCMWLQTRRTQGWMCNQRKKYGQFRQVTNPEFIWCLIARRAFPTCYLKGSYWGPVPFLLYCMNPQETSFLALLGELQVPPYPLEPRYNMHKN